MGGEREGEDLGGAGAGGGRRKQSEGSTVVIKLQSQK